MIQQFLSEGAGYTLLSGIVGTALGVGATYLIAIGFKAAFGDFFSIEPYVSLRSMVIAYCLGVVITFLAVAISSWRVSRLNVVAAVRDIPDTYVPHRNRRQLIWSIVMVVAGALLLTSGLQAEQQAPFTIGFTLIPFGIAGILTYFGAMPRLVLTLAGLVTLVFWLLPEDIFTDLFGEMSGDIEMFFVSGICIVAASTLVIVQNLGTILAFVEHLGGRVRGMLAPTRLAVSYPGANKGRTGYDDRDVQPDRLLAGDDRRDQCQLHRRLPQRQGVRRLGCAVEVSRENPIDDSRCGDDRGGCRYLADRRTSARVDMPGEGSMSYLTKDNEWMQTEYSVG